MTRFVINSMPLGSTIEMLRSENIQVRSQLSTIQRRMFQEKQQIMDYLRQIENDLVEKEQIKQREALLRDERDQLQLINQQDRVKIEHLVETLRTTNEKNSQLERELDTHKSLTQQLSSRLEVNRWIRSIDLFNNVPSF